VAPAVDLLYRAAAAKTRRDEDSMIYVLATLRIKDGTRDAFLAGARDMIAATVKEEGCLFYDLHQSVTDPNRFMFVERWTSREALGEHFNVPHMKTWRAISSACISQPNEVEIISPADVEKR
jgi:quinol monooxygenase YgiN